MPSSTDKTRSITPNQTILQQALLASLDNTPLALVCWRVSHHADGIHVVDWNLASQHIFGWGKEEVLGKDFFDFLVADVDKPLVSETVEMLKTSTFPQNLRNYCNTKQGDHKLVNWYNTPFFNAEEEEIYVISLGEDITKKAQMEIQLQESERKYRSLFYENHSVMLLIDPATGAILDANSAATFFYGYTFDELTAMNIKDINQNMEAQVQMDMEEVLESKRKRFFFRHRLANGEIRHVEVFSGEVTIKGRQRIYSIIHDITDRVRAEEELQIAKATVETASKLKSVILSHVSHEIRTPMNSILGFAELLEQGHDQSDQQQLYLKFLKQGASDLMNTLNNIMEAAELVGGEMKPQASSFRPFAILNFLKERLEREKRKLGREHLAIKMENALEVQDILIHLDKDKLFTLLWKLADNALKFTQTGSIVVGCEQIVDGGIRFWISDTGPGIEAKKLERIFEMFRQGNEALNRQHTGLGLGLPIAHGMADLLGATLEIDSHDEGTTISVNLPAAVV